MIKKQLKNIAIETFASSGFAPLIQKAISKRCISIFTYHAVIDTPLTFPDWCFLDSHEFQQQMSYLKKHFDVISLTEACERIQNESIESPAAVITFDDGYRNNHDIALPILQTLELPATIYLNSAFVDTDDSVWFTRVHQALVETNHDNLTWDGRSYPLTSLTDKETCSREVQTAFKQHHPSKVSGLITTLRTQLGLPAELPPLDNSFRMLTSQQVTAMQATGLIEFGAHTVDHTILSHLTKAEQEKQIYHSISEVERITHQTSRHFAYPNGGKSDFNADSISLLNDRKCTSATTMVKGKCTHKSELLQLPRYPIGADTNLARFKLMAHHLL